MLLFFIGLILGANIGLIASCLLIRSAGKEDDLWDMTYCGNCRIYHKGVRCPVCKRGAFDE